MSFRRAYWDGPAFATLDHERLAVGYKHHLDRVSTSPGEETVFFNYHARTLQKENEGQAWEWGMDFKLAVERSGKMIIAEPEWDGGKLVSVGFMDCYGAKLNIEVIEKPFETIKIGSLDDRSGQWAPDGYDEAEHLWNHHDLRS